MVGVLTRPFSLYLDNFLMDLLATFRAAVIKSRGGHRMFQLKLYILVNVMISFQWKGFQSSGKVLFLWCNQNKGFVSTQTAHFGQYRDKIWTYPFFAYFLWSQFSGLLTMMNICIFLKMINYLAFQNGHIMFQTSFLNAHNFFNFHHNKGMLHFKMILLFSRVQLNKNLWN